MTSKKKIDAKQFSKVSEKLKGETGKYSELGQLSVRIGLPDDRKHNPSGLMLSELGTIHEFGSGNIPERPFLRGTAINRKKELSEGLNTTAEKVQQGMDPMRAMEGLAIFGAETVKEYISSGIDPATGEGKTPLIDTGAMRQGIIGIVVAE